MEKTSLTDKALEERIDSMLSEADILIGIPSYNNARTIGHVVRAVRTGLAKYFPEARAVLVNSDGGSTDGTPDVVLNTKVEDFSPILVSHKVGPTLSIATPYHGIPGKGSAFRTIFEIAAKLRAKACAVVDADLRSITPEWIELLVKPVLEGYFDYVAPLYQRHKYDGTITNSIIYPLTRALYRKRVRQPIGGDFGFSGELAGFYLTKDVWQTDVARYGIDIWMTTTAIANNFRVCQAFLGAKIHDQKDPASDLSAMLSQVVGATFDLMEEYAGAWRVEGPSEALTTYGFQYAVGVEPIPVTPSRMIEKFRLGVKELMGLWKEVLPGRVIEALNGAQGLPDGSFNIADETWADIVYSFALAAHRKAMNREHLLKCVTPLYIGRTASFVLETLESDAEEVEKKIERLCRVFEARKAYLMENW
ncbi:MAG: glycosyltransferase [Thermodesulfovibrionales bacterium]